MEFPEIGIRHLLRSSFIIVVMVCLGSITSVGESASDGRFKIYANDLEKLGLTGPVWTLMVEVIDTYPEEVNTQRKKKSYSQYPTIFDERGNRIAAVTHFKRKDVVLFCNSYGAIGERVSTVPCDYGGRAITGQLGTFYEYTEKGHRKSETIVQLPEGPAVSKSLFSFDAQGRLLEVSELDGQGKPQWRSNYVYDVEGRLAEEDRYRCDDGSCNQLEIGKRYTYDHDEHSEEINLIHDLQAAKSFRLAKQILKFDDHNNLIDIRSYLANGTLVRHETSAYKYDSYGNWIEQLTISFSTAAGERHKTKETSTRRHLTYFDDDSITAVK